MYEQDGKQYTIKLNDFAEENAVSVRTVQKKLTADRYKKDLEGEFIRTASDGTWLSEAAAEFLRSTLRTRAVGYVSDSTYERRIADLERKLFETQEKYTAYVDHATPLLQKASEQLALAERSEEYKSKAAALEAQNGDLSAENKELKETVKEEKQARQAAEKTVTAFEKMSVFEFIKFKLRKGKKDV